MVVLKTLAAFEWFYQIPFALGALAIFGLTFVITFVLVDLVHRIPILRDWL